MSAAQSSAVAPRPARAARARAWAATPRGRFALGVAALALLGLAIRVIYILAVYPDSEIGGDGIEFHWLSRFLADGYGYVQSPPLVERPPGPPTVEELVYRPRGEVFATAHKPPLYPVSLLPATLLDPSSLTLQRLASAVMGTGTIVVLALVGRRLGGARVGLIAAAIAAVYPLLWATDGALRSETLLMLLIGLVVLASLRVLERATWQRAAVLGALIGLAALTRSEAILLAPFLALPLCLLAARGRRWLPPLAALVATALLVVPWVVRNTLEFDRLTFISTNEGGVLYGANCPPAYRGPFIGTWACFFNEQTDRNEATATARARERGLDYARDNLGRVPAVVAVRELRAFDLWEFPAGTVEFEAMLDNRSLTAHEAGTWMYYVLALLALGGAWALRRRRAELLVLLAPVAVVVVVVATSYGTSRFRAPAEVTIVVLAALALERLAARALARRSVRDGDRADGGDARPVASPPESAAAP